MQDGIIISYIILGVFFVSGLAFGWSILREHKKQIKEMKKKIWKMEKNMTWALGKLEWDGGFKDEDIETERN